MRKLPYCLRKKSLMSSRRHLNSLDSRSRLNPCRDKLRGKDVSDKTKKYTTSFEIIRK